MRIGYARRIAASDLELQKTALIGAKCDKIFCELTNDDEAERPQLDACLAYLRKDDILVVWRLGRIGKDLRDFLNLQSILSRRGIGFESITENIETSSRAGRMVSRAFQSLCKFDEVSDSDFIQPVRTDRVTKSVRPKKVWAGTNYDFKIEKARALMDSNEYSIADVAEMCELSKAMVYKVWTAR